jgi:hypothetical protein
MPPRSRAAPKRLVATTDDVDDGIANADDVVLLHAVSPCDVARTIGSGVGWVERPR